MNMDASEISKKRRVLFYTGLSALMLVVVACTCGQLGSIPGISGSADGEATPTLITLDGGSDGGSGGDSGGDAFNFVDPENASLDSYHAQITMKYSGTKEDGTPVDGTFTMEQWHTSDPVAMRIVMSGVGDALSPDRAGETNMVIIGDTSYIITDVNGEDKCISLQSDLNETSSTEGYSPNTFLNSTDMSGAQRVLPDEVVNGVLSQHWRFTKSDVELLTPGWTSYTVDAWTAVDGGYAVKSIFVGDGDNVSLAGGQGHVEWEFNLIEANTGIVIEPPEGCDAPGAGDIPQMPDATDVAAMTGFVSYSTASSVDEVVAFYTAEMPAAGWTAGDSNNLAGMATMTFTKEDKTISITITNADGKTSVLIVTQ